MKKIKEILKNVNILVVILCIYLTKVLILDPTYQDTIIFICLTAMCSYKFKLDQFKPNDINDKVKKDIAVLKDAISKQNLTKLKKNIRF